MANARLKTVVSTKGQVILPKSVRDELHWEPGTQLLVETTAAGVLLTASPLFAMSRPEDVFGCLPYKGKAKTLKDMEAGIAAEAKRRYARD